MCIIYFFVFLLIIIVGYYLSTIMCFKEKEWHYFGQFAQTIRFIVFIYFKVSCEMRSYKMFISMPIILNKCMPILRHC